MVHPPIFHPTRLDAATIRFDYDRPASCTTAVTWGMRSDSWRGWVATDPPAHNQRAELRWSTPYAVDGRVADLALRFRAQLVPPPPPTATPVPTVHPDEVPDTSAISAQMPRGYHAMSIGMSLQPTPDIIPTPPPMRDQPAPGGPTLPPPVCAPQPLIALDDVRNAHGGTAGMQLHAAAAASFALVRAEIIQRSGRDPLARLADALRSPEFRSSKPGVALMSWHMAGRAIDLDVGAGWQRRAEGPRWRLFLGNLDVTEIFERYGWQRIPDRADSPEWWHYEYRADGVTWFTAMRQIWPPARLRLAFPQFDWEAIGCDGGSIPIGSPAPPSGVVICVADLPRFGSTIEQLTGCGPPLRVGERVFQLNSTIGYVADGMGRALPGLHLGLRVRRYDGTQPRQLICTPFWLGGRHPPPGSRCTTEMADPTDFLPRAAAGLVLHGTPIADGAPYQLPPPGHPGSIKGDLSSYDHPPGQYWSPYADGGAYGGGDALADLRAGSCRIWAGWPWC